MPFLARSADIEDLLGECRTIEDARLLVAISLALPENAAVKRHIEATTTDLLHDKASREVLSYLVEQIKDVRVRVLSEGNFDILSFIFLHKKAFPDAKVLSRVWNFISDEELAPSAAALLTLALPISSEKFDAWPYIKAGMARDPSSALKAWLAWSKTDNGAWAYDEYWSILQQHLKKGSLAQQNTKFALQVMRNTFTRLPDCVNLDHFHWDRSGSSDLWYRFLTLVEIVGVDTSHNQTMDSAHSIVAICSPRSPITASWVLVLLEAGLTCNMEPIKDFMCEILMSFDDAHLRCLRADPHFVARVLLPQAALAGKFVVDDAKNCGYIDVLLDFARKLVKAFDFDTPALLRAVCEENLERRMVWEAPRLLIWQGFAEYFGNFDFTTARLVAEAGCSAAQNSRAAPLAQATQNACYSLVFRNFTDGTPEEYALLLGIMGVNGLDWLDVREVAAWLPYSNLPSSSHLYSAVVGELQVPMDELFVASEDPLKEIEEVRPGRTREERRKTGIRVSKLFDEINDCPENVAFEAFVHEDARLAILKCLQRRHQPPSVELLQKLWECMKETGLRQIDRPAHHALIAILNRVVGSAESLALDIVCESFARRDILGPLVDALYSRDEEWVGRVMASAYAQLHLEHPAYLVDSILATRLGTYEEFWGLPDSYARARAISWFDKGSPPQLADWILTSSTFKLLKPGKSHDGDEERIRCLGFQLILILQKHGVVGAEVLPKLDVAINIETSPMARVYIEWLYSRLLVSFPDQVARVTENLSRQLAPRLVSSFGRIAVLVAMVRQEPAFLEKIVSKLLPLATNNRAQIRHFAQGCLYAMAHISRLLVQLKEPWRDLVVDTADITGMMESYRDFKPGDELFWDISDVRLGPVCGGVVSKVLENRIPGDYLTTEDLIQYLGGSSEDFGDGWQPEPASSMALWQHLTAIKGGNEPLHQIQTKAAADDLNRTELVVVASLCDLVPNIGGICRLCDALGVGELVLGSLAVTASQHFKSTAVSADRWMPMKECSIPDLPEYLLDMKRKGFTLVGLEQTDSSRKLNPSLKFPRKTLLLIGREREGIDGDLLALLDWCVEIEQKGVVRSMNIQTATAVLVHSYNQQCE